MCIRDRDNTKTVNDKCYHRIITGTIDAELFALDGKTGELCSDFGENGKVDLRDGLGAHNPAYYYSVSPPAIIGNLIILGGGVTDNVSTSVPGGVVRAYNIRTGDLEWYWDPVPPGMEINSSDNGNAEYQRGTANVWSIISTDPDLNLIYLPTGNASPDYYGGHREGLDYYNSSIVALHADTGEVAWHFKTVYHDVWDYDVPSQPTFYDIEKDFEFALKGIFKLPDEARFGVYTAYKYYNKLLMKLKRTPSDSIQNKRIRVPNYQKITVFARSYLKYRLNLL